MSLEGFPPPITGRNDRETTAQETNGVSAEKLENELAIRQKQVERDERLEQWQFELGIAPLIGTLQTTMRRASELLAQMDKALEMEVLESLDDHGEFENLSAQVQATQDALNQTNERLTSSGKLLDRLGASVSVLETAERLNSIPMDFKNSYLSYQPFPDQ